MNVYIIFWSNPPRILSSLIFLQSLRPIHPSKFHVLFFKDLLRLVSADCMYMDMNDLLKHRHPFRAWDPQGNIIFLSSQPLPIVPQLGVGLHELLLSNLGFWLTWPHEGFVHAISVPVGSCGQCLCLVWQILFCCRNQLPLCLEIFLHSL